MLARAGQPARERQFTHASHPAFRMSLGRYLPPAHPCRPSSRRAQSAGGGGLRVRRARRTGRERREAGVASAASSSGQDRTSALPCHSCGGGGTADQRRSQGLDRPLAPCTGASPDTAVAASARSQTSAARAVARAAAGLAAPTRVSAACGDRRPGGPGAEPGCPSGRTARTATSSVRWKDLLRMMSEWPAAPASETEFHGALNPRSQSPVCDHEHEPVRSQDVDITCAFEYILFMPSTTVHIPAPLLETVDAHARALGISRNRFILRALERVLEEGKSWSPDFLAELRRPLSGADSAAVESMVHDVLDRLSSKGAPRL